jgi:hypothetical protein
MRTYLDCIPCFVRQTLDVCRFVSDDEAFHEHIVREILATISRVNTKQNPPTTAMQLHRIIREMTGNTDPYRKAKHDANQAALELLPSLRRRVQQARNPFREAVRLVIAANAIDYGIGEQTKVPSLDTAIESVADAEILGNCDKLHAAIEQAENILYLADNAGEIVLDRLLLERLPIERVTLAVRGKPIINDATLDDTIQAGLDKLLTVIDNGSDLPGTMLSLCSDAFRKCFESADLIIAKGQGNFETLLPQARAGKPIHFLLKVKCSVIARLTQKPLGSLAIIHDVPQKVPHPV